MLFAKYCPHLPLLFLQAQTDMRKEGLKIECPEKARGGYKLITGKEYANPSLLKNQPRWRMDFFQKYPTTLDVYNNAPQHIRLDPTYCPFPRKRTWGQFFSTSHLPR